jgi:hypothetical protein
MKAVVAEVAGSAAGRPCQEQNPKAHPN